MQLCWYRPGESLELPWSAGTFEINEDESKISESPCMAVKYYWELISLIVCGGKLVAKIWKI